MKAKLIRILGKFKGKNILVVGDIMLDKYIFGKVERISPEAPVQVVEVEKESYVPGGAANVANNISALGGNTFMIGVVGKDKESEILISELNKRGINTQGILTDKDKPTTQKVRVLGQKQQLLRIDYEKKEYLSRDFEKKMISTIKNMISGSEAIIISDYAKGVITGNLMKEIKVMAKGKTLVIDPKPKHKSFYSNASIVTPNTKEAIEMTGIEDIETTGKQLLNQLNSPILITRGEKGMSLFEKEDITNIPTKAKEVYDVSGAGDTVVAALALALASGATLKEAATLANHAAGIKVGKLGTSTVTIDEIKQSIENE